MRLRSKRARISAKQTPGPGLATRVSCVTIARQPPWFLAASCSRVAASLDIGPKGQPAGRCSSLALGSRDLSPG